MSFAEGSIFNYPVRKFFEVPTFGTLLVAIPPNDSENIGFVSGETYVEATEDGLVDTAVSILRDPDRAKYIMQNAQQMIRDIHSSSARMAQIFSCIDRIFEGTYAGATWVKGRVKIVSPV